MIEAGREERWLAIERGDYLEGVPAITVIVDGGWSKWSHHHSCNAKSVVGIIIGQGIGKLLHIGLRNKYCSTCASGIPSEKHVCYKHWDKSSSEMEADIILEGLKQAEQVHGVQYKRFVGDGDRSVYPTLIQSVPGWGRHIEKLECVNHASKCYRSALEKNVLEKPQYKGKGGLTKKMHCRLTSAGRYAIKMRSRETQEVKSLKRDLSCFGLHDNCNLDFCLTAMERIGSE